MELERLKKLLDERKEEILEGIRECMRIDSVMGTPAEGAPYGEGPKEALLYALNLGERLGLRTKNVDNAAGWVEIGEGEEMVGVLGHLDVVPLGDGWNYPGFDLTFNDGNLYGRGILDDKGPTIGAIYALKAIKDAGIPLDRRIRVIFGTNEENGSFCMQHYVECGEEMPALGFTPDGGYPLIFSEKGMTTIQAGKGNVSEGAIKVIRFGGGIAANVVTPECVLEAEGDLDVQECEGIEVKKENGRTLVRSFGKSAHGSMPHLGVNAAIQLLNAVKHIHFGGDFQNLMDFLLNMIGTETNGKTLGIYYQDEETGETTLNLGVLSYTSEKMEFSLDIRYPKNGKHEPVYAAVEEALNNYGLEILDCSVAKLLYVPKDSELVQKLMKVYKRETGRDEEPMAIGGGTYAKMFPNMVAFGPVLPGRPETIHQPNECVSVDDFMLSVWIGAAAMVELAVK